MAIHSLLKLIALGALFHEAAAFASVADPAPAKSFPTYDECVAFAADFWNIVDLCQSSTGKYNPCALNSPHWQTNCPLDTKLECLCLENSTSCEKNGYPKLCKLPGSGPFCATKRPTTGPEYFSLSCD